MLRDTLQHALKFASATVDNVRRQPTGVVVLIYHRVGRRSSLEVDLPTSLFEEQMAALSERGTVRTLEAALDWLDASGDEERAEAPVVVTFDDGTEDLYDIATPILERYRIPFTLYLATEFVDAGVSFPADGRPLSWRALADMSVAGLLTVGSHSHSHALFDRISLPEAASEVEKSSRLIEDRLGYSPAHFAYPKAVAPSASIESLVRRSYRSAALAGTRANPRGSTDPHRLARSPVQLGDGMRWFERKLDGGMALEDYVRRAANRWRYSHASK